MKDIDGLEKDTVKFTCELSKPDRKDGKWTKDETEITVSEHFIINTDGVNQTLEVAELTLEDRGHFKYSIESVSTEATLHINGKLEKPTIITYM